MATISTDTAIEDLSISSGETFTFSNNAILTISTDVSAYTGLKATGTGTIRLLNGGCADFSGAALPETITIEGGTAESPLPAHRDAGEGETQYPARAAAVILLRASSATSAHVISHCAGNASRPQGAIVTASTSTSITLDRDMELETNDVIGWTNGGAEASRAAITVDGYTSNTITHSSGTTVPVGSVVMLLTSGFVVGALNSYNPYFTGIVEGDEIGFMGGRGNATISGGECNIGRAAIIPYDGDTTQSTICAFFGPSSGGSVGKFCSMGWAISPLRSANALRSDSVNIEKSSPIEIGEAWSCGFGNYGWGGVMYHRAVYRCCGGAITAPCNNRMHCELIDMTLPSTLYGTLVDTSEIVIRNTTDGTHVVHRADGIATLVQQADLPDTPPIPEAWELAPTDSNCTAWHDQPFTIKPQQTLTIQWYSRIGTGGAAGVQILDGDNALFGQVAVPMGVADVLAEYTLPEGTTTGAWLPVKRLSWRNTTSEPKKVVLRGWASGATGYLYIRVAQGGPM